MEYPSVRGAEKTLASTPNKISRAKLIRLLKDPAVQYAVYLDSEDGGISHGSIPIFAKKNGTPLLLFSSIRKVLDAGFAKSHFEVIQKVEKNMDGWRYALLNDDGKPMQGPCMLKDKRH
jgi:hypothetical protein